MFPANDPPKVGAPTPDLQAGETARGAPRF